VERSQAARGPRGAGWGGVCGLVATCPPFACAGGAGGRPLRPAAASGGDREHERAGRARRRARRSVRVPAVRGRRFFRRYACGPTSGLLCGTAKSTSFFSGSVTVQAVRDEAIDHVLTQLEADLALLDDDLKRLLVSLPARSPGRRCAICRAEFSARRSHARYCGAACRQRASRARRASAAAASQADPSRDPDSPRQAGSATI